MLPRSLMVFGVVFWLWVWTTSLSLLLFGLDETEPLDWRREDLLGALIGALSSCVPTLIGSLACWRGLLPVTRRIVLALTAAAVLLAGLAAAKLFALPT